jgi:hypothetical protein
VCVCVCVCVCACVCARRGFGAQALHPFLLNLSWTSQVARMLNREPIVHDGGLVGGPVHTWQTRLASILRP